MMHPATLINCLITRANYCKREWGSYAQVDDIDYTRLFVCAALVLNQYHQNMLSSLDSAYWRVWWRSDLSSHSTRLSAYSFGIVYLA